MNNMPPNSPHELDAHLNKILDGALASYTPVAPRSGFEARLHAGLAAEQAHLHRPMLPLPWVFAGAVIFASVAGLLVLVHRSRIPAPSSHQAEARQGVSPEKHGPEPGSLDDSLQSDARIKANAKVPAQQLLPSAPPRRPARKDQPASAIDLAALREFHAPSHPAPEEPLTEQEKLLLRIVRKGDPQEMAMLNPEVRERQEEQAEAEFHKFVEESIRGENE